MPAPIACPEECTSRLRFAMEVRHGLRIEVCGKHAAPKLVELIQWDGPEVHVRKTDV